MEWFYQLDFLQRGVSAGLMIGLIAPLIGSFLLVRKMSIISEGLSHITLTGIATGVLIVQTAPFLSFMNPMYLGVVFSLIGSLIVEKLRQLYKYFEELAIPIILSAGIGLSALLISYLKSSYNEWYSYLFGSIVTVTHNDLIFIFLTGFLTLGIVLLTYKKMLSISFDQEFAQTSGISVKKLNVIFSLLIALVISMSMKVVGILLVGAMITLPVATSIQFAKSFKQVILYGILFGEAAMIGGLIISYYLNVAAGGMIVVVAFTFLVVSILIKRIVHLFSKRYQYDPIFRRGD